MASRSGPRVSWVLLIVLLSALAIGAAASILVSASTAPPASSGPAPLVFLPLWAVVAASAGVLGFVVLTMVFWRLSSTSNPALNRMAVVVLVVILLGTLFILAEHLLGFGAPLFPSGNSTSSGNSGSSSGNGNGGQNLTGPGGRVVVLPNLPGWVPFVILAAVALLVVVFVVPPVRAYLADRRQRGVPAVSPGAAAPAGVRDALARASKELDLGADPRVVILALYAALLKRLGPVVGDIEASTPEEIRADHLVRLGVRPEEALALTRLFEEARYSAHPMGPEASARVRDAVQRAIDDLDRRNFPA